jgi:hypothetical protein
MRLNKKVIRFLEFAIIGVVMGTFEDSIAVYFVTGEKVTFDTVWIIVLVAIPFAFISEYVVDHPKFWERLKIFRKDQDPHL